MRHFLVLLMFFWISHAYAGDNKALLSEQGIYEGTGRACYGKLRIEGDKISWMTPFSQCASSSFVVRDRATKDGASHVVYELLKPSSECLYRVLVLSYKKENNYWSVDGFSSWEEYKVDGRDKLSCYLVK